MIYMSTTSPWTFPMLVIHKPFTPTGHVKLDTPIKSIFNPIVTTIILNNDYSILFSCSDKTFGIILVSSLPSNHILLITQTFCFNSKIYSVSVSLSFSGICTYFSGEPENSLKRPWQFRLDHTFHFCNNLLVWSWPLVFSLGLVVTVIFV